MGRMPQILLEACTTSVERAFAGGADYPIRIVTPEGIHPRTISGAKGIPCPIGPCEKRASTTPLVAATERRPAESRPPWTKIIMVATNLACMFARIRNNSPFPAHAPRSHCDCFSHSANHCHLLLIFEEFGLICRRERRRKWKSARRSKHY